MPEPVTQRMEIRVPGKPIPWKRAGRDGKMSFTLARMADWQKMVILSFLCVRADWVKVPAGVPVCVDIDFIFKRPKNHTKHQRLHERSKATRPDKDNLEKAVLDALGRVNIYADDGQVVDGRVRKLWSDDNWQGAIIIVASGDYLTGTDPAEDGESGGIAVEVR